MLNLLLLSHRYLRFCSLFFQSTLSYFKVWKFYWYAFTFTDYFLCHLYRWAVPVGFLTKKLVIVYFMFIIFQLVLLYTFEFFGKILFSFVAKEFIIDFLSIFIIVKSILLSENYSIWFIFVLASVDCVFSFKLWFS